MATGTVKWFNETKGYLSSRYAGARPLLIKVALNARERLRPAEPPQGEWLPANPNFG